MNHNRNYDIARRLKHLAAVYGELAKDAEALYEGYAGGINWDQQYLAWDEADSLVHELQLYAECMKADMEVLEPAMPANTVTIE